MTRRAWLASVIGWDGALPAIVILVSVALRGLLPDQDLAILTSFIVLPVAAALARSAQGQRQLEKRFGTAPFGRQLLLVIAILVLVLFESLMGVVDWRRGLPPLVVWLIALAIYLVYLGFAILALRPRKWTDAEPLSWLRLSRTRLRALAARHRRHADDAPRHAREKRSRAISVCLWRGNNRVGAWGLRRLRRGPGGAPITPRVTQKKIALGPRQTWIDGFIHVPNSLESGLEFWISASDIRNLGPLSKRI